MKRTTIFLADADRDAIHMVKQRYGVSSDSDAIRLALRVLASAQNISVSPLPQPTLDSRYWNDKEENAPVAPHLS